MAFAYYAAAPCLQDFSRVPRPLFCRNGAPPAPSAPSADRWANARARVNGHADRHGDHDSLSTEAAVFVPGALHHAASVARADEATAAVISVKKSSSRGCAYVLLRDEAVFRRALAQRVAVIDGVCVEIREHFKRSIPKEQQPLGVFIAWGVRVERRVTITEEGMEEYFNSLQGKPMPDGLVPKAPFEECLLRFPLSSAGDLRLATKVSIDNDVGPTKLLEGDYCGADFVHALWQAKKRLDDRWQLPPPPMARSVLTRVARSQLFPQSSDGGDKHENRAGDKLAELVKTTGLLEQVPVGSAFLDLCGGPGAWSQYMLERGDLKMQGFGMTLRAGAGAKEDWKADEKDMWYADLLSSAHWKALWGADGSGDLLKLGNLEHVAAAMKKATDGRGVFLCLADGGFSDDSIPANQLELYCYRLFLAEVLMATSCLQPGGHFVCKLYSTFSQASASLLALVTRLFEDVAVVKPKSSKATGPERYLVAKGYRAASQETATIKAALAQSHALGKGSSPLLTPLLTPLVAAADLAKDVNLVQQLRAMTTTICERNAVALNAVVDRAEYLEEMATNVNSEMQTLPHKKPEYSAAVACATEKEVEAPRSRRRGRVGGA